MFVAFRPSSTSAVRRCAFAAAWQVAEQYDRGLPVPAGGGNAPPQ